MTGIEFLKVFFAGTEHDIEIRPLPKYSRLFNRDWVKIAKYISKAMAARKNLYFGCTTRRPMPNDKGEMQEIAGGKENAAEVAAFWCDLDYKEIPENDAIQRIGAFPIPPSIVIASGGGLHVYWLLSKPHDAQDPQVEKILRGIAAKLGADAQCAEIARILRVPGTKNFKEEYGQPRDVTIALDNSDKRYQYSEFTQFAMLDTPAALAPAPAALGIPIPKGIRLRDALAPALVTKEYKRQGAIYHAYHGLIGYDGNPQPCLIQGSIHEQERGNFKQCAFVEIDGKFFHSCFDTDCREKGQPIGARGTEMMDPGDVSSKTRLAVQNLGLADVLLSPNGASTESRPEVAKLLAEFNERFFVVENFGGKCVICWESTAKDAFGREVPLLEHQSFFDFKNRYMHQLIKVGEETVKGEVIDIYESKAKVWLNHRNRRQYRCVEFAPGIELPPDVRNLWRGFAYEPRAGDCSKYLAHVKDNICQGSEEHHTWLIAWMAHAVRHPAQNGEVAIVVRGLPGVGKNVFAEGFNSLFGRHGILLNNEKSITSNFNAHFLGKCSLIADESFFAGDHRQVRLLKGLINGKTIAIERKGIDTFTVPNLLHIIILGNDEWLINATNDERRFFVLGCGEAQQKKFKYFKAIADELESGGYEALLYHLLYKVDLSNFEVRNAPHTDVLREQIVESLTGADGIWYECLFSGELPGATHGNGHEMNLHIGSLLENFNKRSQKLWSRVNTKKMSTVLTGKGKGSMGFERVDRAHGERRLWKIPPLCRRLWDAKKGKVEWPDGVDEWNAG